MFTQKNNVGIHPVTGDKGGMRNIQIELATPQAPSLARDGDHARESFNLPIQSFAILSVILGPAASASHENLLEMEVLRSCGTFTES